MISQLKVQKLKVSTLDFDCKHLFTEKTSGEYKRAIDLASNSVIDFLENNTTIRKFS
ncbi:hypothetical protein ABF176_000768 [Flavobacterium psychrophilum]